MMPPNQSMGALAALRKMAQRMGPNGAPMANQMTGAPSPAAMAGGGLGGAGAAIAAMNAMQPGGPGGAPQGQFQPGPQPQPGMAPLQAPDAPVAPPPEMQSAKLGDEDQLLRQAQMSGEVTPESLMQMAEELFSFLPPERRQMVVMRALMMGQSGAGQPQMSALPQ